MLDQNIDVTDILDKFKSKEKSAKDESMAKSVMYQSMKGGLAQDITEMALDVLDKNKKSKNERLKNVTESAGEKSA